MLENLKGDTLIIRSNHASRDFLLKLSEYRDRDYFTDIVLDVDNCKIKAHKLILSSCSPYFEKMFTTKGFIENSMNQITLAGFNSDALKSIIDFMYNGILKITSFNIETILSTVDLLLMESLKGCCFRYLQQTITNENSLTYLNLGDMYCSQEVQASTKRFIRRNYHEIKNERNEKILSDLFSHQELENFVLNNKTTGQYIIAVAFDSKEIEYLDINDIDEGWNLLTEIPEMRYGICGSSLTTYDEKIVITGGVGKEGIMTPLSRHLIYDIKENRWTEGPPLLQPRKCHGSIITDDKKLYIIGGTDIEGNNILKGEVLNLNSICDGWKEIQGLSSFGNNIVLQKSLQNNIVALSSSYSGGSEFIYNSSLNEWYARRTQYERLSRDHPGIGTDDKGRIVIAGGHINGEKIKIVERYNEEKNDWELLPELNHPRQNPGVMSLNDGKLLIIGGKGSNGIVEILENDKWTDLTSKNNLKFSDQEYVVGSLGQKLVRQYLMAVNIQAYGLLITQLHYNFIYTWQKMK